jgi:hypothetical protein
LTTVKDYEASIEKLRRDAAEAALIRDLATNPTKREMFDRLHQHLTPLTPRSREVERAGECYAIVQHFDAFLKPPSTAEKPK